MGIPLHLVPIRAGLISRKAWVRTPSPARRLEKRRPVRPAPQTTAARIGGVPALAVDGKFLINNEAASSYEDLLRITDTVIAKARQDRKGK